MKKIFGLLLLLCAVLGLTACGGEETFDGNGDIFSGEWDVYKNEHLVTTPVTIDFWSANSAVDIHGVEMAEMVKKFNQYQQETYPSSAIKVNVSFQGGYVTQNSKLQAALISQTNPDIAMVGVSSLSVYKDNALDVRNYLTFDQIENIHEGFRQFAMYQNKFIGYPYFASSNVLLVNKTEVEKTTVKLQTVDEIVANPDQSTWTWDQFQQLAKELTHVKEDNKPFYGVATATIPAYEGFFTQGVSIYNETATKPNFNNEAGVKLLTMWQNLVKNGYMINPVINPNHGTQIQADFIEGNSGILFSTSAAIKQIHENINDKFEVDVLPHPKDTDFYTNQSGGSLIIFEGKNEARKKAAVEFFRWLYEDKQQVNYSIATGYLATTKSATASQAWVDYAKINPLLDKVVKMMSLGMPEGTRLPIGRAKALADDDLAKYIKAIWYDDASRDIKEVLKETEERVGYLLETNS